MVFKKKQKDITSELADTISAITPPLPDLNDVYTIGNNRNGDTIISLKSGTSSMILTMGPAEVNRMIRLLKATLEHYEIEEDNKD
jgi:hypothetical protein